MNRNIEAKLIKDAVQGDVEAFSAIYDRLCDSVYAFAFRMLSDKSAAEDITQETFIFLVENPQKFDAERGSLNSFLCGVARNLIRHYLRKRERNREDAHDFDNFIEIRDEAALNPLEILLETELSEFVYEYVAKLPEQQREVLILRELQKFSYEEIAKITASDINLVKVRLHRGRKILAGKLAPYLRKKEKCNEV